VEVRDEALDDLLEALRAAVTKAAQNGLRELLVSEIAGAQLLLLGPWSVEEF
jgi:hypothetical protein